MAAKELNLTVRYFVLAVDLKILYCNDTRVVFYNSILFMQTETEDNLK